MWLICSLGDRPSGRLTGWMTGWLAVEFFFRPSFFVFKFLFNFYYSKPLLLKMTFFFLWTLAKMRNSETMWILVFNACTFAKNAHFCNMMDSFKLLNIFFRIQIDELIRTCQLFEYCFHETWGLASFPPLTTRLLKQICISITLFTNFTDEQLFNTTSNDISRWN